MAAAQIPVKKLVRELGSDPENGLGHAEAESRLGRYGKNVIFEKKAGFHWGIFGFLKEPMIWLLGVAAMVYYIIGDTLDAAIMAAAIAPIALMDFIIERQTDKALEKLEKLGEPRVSVLRGGEKTVIHPDNLVPGDLMLVKEGDIMMADCAVLSGSDIRADESPLTGESVPVEKAPQELFSEEFFANRGSLFAGTRILSGRAYCMVVKTGASTSYGKIGKMLGKTVRTRTKLHEDVENIVRKLGVLAVLVSLVLVGNELYAGHGWSDAIISGVSFAIAAIPEEFPVVFTLFLSLGLLALAKNNAVVKRLTAVETLGSVSVICSDKTGTLTSGRMAVGEIFTDWNYSAAEFLRSKGSERFLLRALMACEKDPFDYMEKAIYEYAKVSPALAEIARWNLVEEYAFDPRMKLMSHVWKKDYMEISAKGAVEGIMERCTLTPAEKKRIHAANAKMCEQGMRVLAFACRKLRKNEGREKDERNLEFCGLVGFFDPLREGVAEAVAEAQAAGIKVVMLTGDHMATAQFISGQIGLFGGVYDGRKLSSLSEKELLSVLNSSSAFSRVLPEEKLRIVEGFQKLGYSVAVTGDGINDAPALKRADIGIAMGERGTEVAKEAAALVLLDDNFNTIVSAIRNGRRIYDNLQKAFGYLIAFHIPIFLSALVIPTLGLPLFLLPIHLVLLELVLHPTISIAFERQPAEPGIMARKPRERSRPMLEKPEVLHATASGIVLFLVTLFAYSQGAGMRPLAFTVLLLGQLLLMLSWLSASRIRPSHLWDNKPALGTLVLMSAAYLVAMHVPFLQEIVKITPLAGAQWALALVLAVVPFVFSELSKGILKH